MKSSGNVIFTNHSNQKRETEFLVDEIEAMARKAAGSCFDTGDLLSFGRFTTDVRTTAGLGAICAMLVQTAVSSSA